MESGRFLRFMSRGLVTFGAIALMAVGAGAASTTKVIYTFAGEDDGEYIDSDLVIDGAGNLYGSSVQGGLYGSGTVWQLSPSASGWTHTVLYNFTGGADGGEPYKGVTLDAQGNLYGTAVTGGGGSCEGGCGVTFKLTKSGSTWTQSVIHTFTGGNDGSGPGSGVTFDRHGNLYGMTPTGGANGVGTIYALKPQSDGSYKLRVIHTFTGGRDGLGGSAGRLLLGGRGQLYGVSTVGGVNGEGTAFVLTPTQSGQFTFQVIYAFKGSPDAGFPYGALLADKQGNLYGTTYYDGAHDFGSVYQLKRNGNSWTESVIYSFKGGTDGSSSISNLVIDAAGNLYGTTSEGGSGCSCGVIFKLAPGTGGKWTESVVHAFTGAPDAGFAYNGMVGDSNGNFFGATVHGGPDDDGTVYQFNP